MLSRVILGNAEMRRGLLAHRLVQCVDGKLSVILIQHWPAHHLAIPPDPAFSLWPEPTQRRQDAFFADHDIVMGNS